MSEKLTFSDVGKKCVILHPVIIPSTILVCFIPCFFLCAFIACFTYFLHLSCTFLFPCWQVCIFFFILLRT